MDNSLIKKTKKSFDVFEAALACIIFIVFNFVFLQIFYALPSAIKTGPFVILANFMLEALFGVASWVVAKTTNIDLIKAAGFNKKVNGKIVWYGFLTAVVSLCMFGMLTYCFMDFLILCGYKPLTSSIKINNFATYIVYIIVSCATPALCEEMLFRGVIQTGLKKYGTKIAVLISTLIFMLMHGSPDQTIHQFIVGMVLGYVFAKSGNIWIGVIIHFFNNFISVTQLYLSSMASSAAEASAQEVATEALISNTWTGLLGEFVFAVLLAFAGYYIIGALIKYMVRESEIVNKKTETINIVSNLETANANNGLLEQGSEKNNENNNLNQTVNVSMKKDEFAINPDDYKIDMNNYVTTGESTENVSSENTNDGAVSENQEVSQSQENGEGLADGQVVASVDDSKKPMSMSTIIMFVLSGGYLVFQWLLTLISGFMG